MHFDDALSKLGGLMPHLVPEIGGMTIFGVRSKKCGRPLRKIDWDILFNDLTPHPTIVIPVVDDGTMSHVFCVVDDLIFDSIAPQALKLQKEAVQWIFNDREVKIYKALRFDMKVSPPGEQVMTTYVRPVTLHWEHPSRGPVGRDSRIQSHRNVVVQVDGSKRKRRPNKKKKNRRKTKKLIDGRLDSIL
jgi:hypothetical protein